MSRIREAAVAGAFYPAAPGQLHAMLDGFLDAAPPWQDGPARALIVPHAGYVYSGGAAAAAYTAVRGLEVDTVILFGPAHRVWFEGISPAPFEVYRLPGGELEVDREAATILASYGAPFRPQPRAHELEHSIEVQLPWLMRLLKPGFRILPLLFGGEQGGMDVGEALLAAAGTKRVLWVCSTDLSHDAPYKEALAMDMRVRDAVAALDARTLAEHLASGQAEACGRRGLLTLLSLFAPGRHTARITAFTNSGDVVGDRSSRIVGYMSAVITENGGAT